MKQKYECARCGAEIWRYPSQTKGKRHLFCSRACLAEARASKELGIDTTRQSENMRRINAELNPTRMTDEVRAKLRERRLGSGTEASYAKLYGRHAHRVVAEQMLGRPLRKGEVIHHMDRNRRNNAPENLMVFASQAEHAKWHKEHDEEVMPNAIQAP